MVCTRGMHAWCAHVVCTRPPPIAVLGTTPFCGSWDHPLLWFLGPPPIVVLGATPFCGSWDHPLLRFLGLHPFVVLGATPYCGSWGHPLLWFLGPRPLVVLGTTPFVVVGTTPFLWFLGPPPSSQQCAINALAVSEIAGTGPRLFSWVSSHVVNQWRAGSHWSL